jgi:putative nucleotidyltransferase with HDIG domain
MLKRISVADLRVGMFVHGLNGSWIDHPFWSRRFLLRDPDDLRRLRASRVRELWIDTARGLDVESASGTGAEAPVEAALPPDESLPQAVAPRAAIDDELRRAAGIYRSARPAVLSMFRQARMGRAIETAQAAAMVDEISASVARNPHALISLSRLKHADDYTFMHSLAVCGLMIALARQLGFEDAQTRQAGLAGLLHDLGKARVPNEVLNKPARLTDEEFERVKQHPELGHALLLESGPVGEVALDVCLHHHERIDGSGYPHGLAGEAISASARMGAVCDVYDAITSNRPYKAGWHPAESIRRMAEWAPNHFDERIFQAFVRSVGIYPLGSLVRLESDRLGVVIDQNGALLTPRVRVFFNTRTRSPIAPRDIDLSLPGQADRIAGREAPQRWGLTDIDRIWAGEEAARIVER